MALNDSLKRRSASGAELFREGRDLMMTRIYEIDEDVMSFVAV